MHVIVFTHAVLPKFSVTLSGTGRRIKRNDTKLRGMVVAK